MALTTTTKMANRYGLNVTIYDYTDTQMATALMTIDFANVSNIEVTSDRVWATGGQDHANMIGFNNPLNGTFTLSTQIMTSELLNLMAGGEAGSATDTIIFQNDSSTAPKYYIVKAETVWQDDAGTTYAETMTFHKACPQRAINISYSGEGDPLSVDVVFDLMQNSDKKLLTITKAA